MDHRALGRGDGTLAFALRCDLFQFLARSEKAGAFRLLWQKQTAKHCANHQERRKNLCADLEQSGQGRKCAKRKSPEERLRKNIENKKINRQRDDHGEPESGEAESSNQKTREKNKRENIGKICDEQNRNKQVSRRFQKPIKTDCGTSIEFYMMAQPHRIDRHHTR